MLLNGRKTVAATSSNATRVSHCVATVAAAAFAPPLGALDAYSPYALYAGKFVGIANGQVVVVADDLEQMVLQLQQVEPDPTKTFGVEVGRDYSVVDEIWALS